MLEDIKIKHCALTAKTTNALHRAGLTTLADIAAVTDEDLLKWPGVGPKGVREIRAIIRNVSSTSTEDVVRWALDHEHIVRALMSVIP